MTADKIVIKRMLCVLMMTMDITLNVLKQQKKIITKSAQVISVSNATGFSCECFAGLVRESSQQFCYMAVYTVRAKMIL
jgi:hypothetical protein